MIYMHVISPLLDLQLFDGMGHIHISLLVPLLTPNLHVEAP